VKGGPRAFVSAFGVAGHVFPAIALARALHGRGYEIWFESRERWRDVIQDVGFNFVAAPEYIAFPRPWPGMPAAQTLPDAVRALVPILHDVNPDVVINDFFTVPAALAAEGEGLRRATIIPHPYPVNEAGLPYFMVGLLPPRTQLGATAWRAARPWFARRARRQRGELNGARAELGLPPSDQLYGAISEDLAIVATFPQLEYPRSWPAHVHVTGPMLFELPHPEVKLPEGDEPLVLVAGSTAQDQELGVVRTALEALADHPVRVVATLNQRGMRWRGQVPPNAKVVDWISYSQVMPRASVVVCNGGHGTVARALAAGAPLVVRPAGGDMGENGARVAWAGAGVMVPRGVFGRRSLRLAVRMVLADGRFAAQARALADWSRINDGALRGAELVERHLAL
jgi:MGT family glycosyltransferase